LASEKDPEAIEKTGPRGVEKLSPERTAHLDQLVQGNNQFAFDLYKRLAKKEGNLVFSPYSISSALAMTYAGARGETAEQMAKVLHFTLGQEQLHPGFGALIADLQSDEMTRPYQLHIANALWGQEGLPFVESFLRTTKQDYRAGLRELDFIRDPADARLRINHWVEEQTKDKIRDLLKPNDITVLTRLVLTNAIYFKAAWKTQFPKEQTREAPFHLSPTETVSVPMMHSEEQRFNYFKGDDFQWLELPYTGDRLAMVILLPRKKGGLAELEKTLTASRIQQGIAKLKPELVHVALPRFKMTTNFRLADTLRKLGMVAPFSDADFSGITSGARLRISNVVHKAFIEVDEVGTEAAAATAVIIQLLNTNDLVFRADHPFLFIIRDSRTNSILFLGRVSDPRS